MFISVLDLFKIGIGPSSSHTMGPMLAANEFIQFLLTENLDIDHSSYQIQCRLKGSLAHTGKGHATDKAVLLGLHGYQASELADQDVEQLIAKLKNCTQLPKPIQATFNFASDILFDTFETLPEHPNGLVFNLIQAGKTIQSKTYFSIGGGFINTLEELSRLAAPLSMNDAKKGPYPFDSGDSMLTMANENQISIAMMKRQNEVAYLESNHSLDTGLNQIWQAMQHCIERGLASEGTLPGKLKVQRRARTLFAKSKQSQGIDQLSDRLCAYAMAVNEENAAGHGVVTAPTNGAAGVIPAVLYYFIEHEFDKLGLENQQSSIHDFLLCAAAIGGIIKHRSSISGAEVGCQGEVGSAAAMAAAGLCAIKGGSSAQIENAAEIALEHHLGMTCDPVAGLVQVPCIERNGFGAIKAYTAASLALSGSGEHLVSLDKCIAAMKQTGKEMSEKYKETSLGGLAVTITEC